MLVQATRAILRISIRPVRFGLDRSEKHYLSGTDPAGAEAAAKDARSFLICVR
jgi:hypothetical protein